MTVIRKRTGLPVRFCYLSPPHYFAIINLMPEPENKQPENFNLHIKNKIINYGIITVLIFIALTVGIKYYLTKSRCNELQNFIFVDGRCTFDYKKTDTKDDSPTPTVLPTPKNNPTQKSSKPSIKFYLTDNLGNKKLILSATEYEAPRIYKNFLIQTQKANHVAYDLNTGQETDFYMALSPQFHNELKETMYQIETTIENKAYSYLTEIYDIDGFTYLTFGGYLASGKILKINQETGAILEIKDVTGNPSIHKINNNYYIFEREGDGCGGMTVIQRLKEPLTQSDTYVIEASCPGGTILLNQDLITSEILILGDYVTPPDDIMYGSRYTSFSTLDLRNYRKNKIFDFTLYDKTGAIEIVNAYYTDGATNLYSNSKGELFILDKSDPKVTLVKNIKLDPEIKYDQETIKFKDGYFCIPTDIKNTEFIAFDTQGIIKGELNANDLCTKPVEVVQNNQNSELNRLTAIANSYNSLPSNISVEVK